METKPLKVSEINSYIKKVLSNDWLLSNVKVEGEISNFTHHYSGHMYFSLKDDKGKIRCVMFRSNNQLLDFQLEDGMKVVITGYISVYEREGDYQLYAKKIEKAGIGDLFKAFEELKVKLDKEGLFDQSKKKPIPYIPKKIGVVTSATGAAVRDIITVTKRRFPIANILIYPVLVQGVQAPEEICKGLEYFDKRDDIDVIIVGRGGGAMEELFAFNDEGLARTIYNMSTPVVSAVGHETDFTIADFVADLRAATPSAAAELVTPELKELREGLDSKYRRLNNTYSHMMNNYNRKMEYFKKDLQFCNPLNQFKDKYQTLDQIFKTMYNLIDKHIKDKRAKLDNLYDSINYLNPTSSLERGYGIPLDQYGNLITDINKLKLDDPVKVILKNGMIEAKVVNISKGEFLNE